MPMVSERNKEKLIAFIHDFIPVKTETFLKFKGYTDIKNVPEPDDWILVMSAGTFDNGDTIHIARKYETNIIKYINTKDELVTVDLTGDYGAVIIKSQLDELLDNAAAPKNLNY